MKCLKFCCFRDLLRQNSVTRTANIPGGALAPRVLPTKVVDVAGKFGAKWELHPNPTFCYPTVYIGDTIDQELVNCTEQIKLRPEHDFDPNRTYHLYVRAKAFNGALGTCNHFPVRKIKLMPYQKVAPLQYPTVPYNSGGPFVWTPSAGAAHYELTVWHWPDVVAREIVTQDRTTINAEGNIEFKFENGSITTLAGSMRWEVVAVHESGDQREAWDPGNPGGSSWAWFFNGADRITDGVSSGGEHGPPNGNIAPVSFVFPVGQTERSTQTCFKVPDNTIGMVWWFGPTSDDIAFDPARNVPVPAASGDGYELCTPTLELTEDDMVLVVWPYSTEIQGNFYGFGPATFFRMQSSTCGASGDSCCAPDDHCVTGAVCQDGTCLSCGGLNEPCCDGRCDNPQGLRCRASTGRCETCGGLGEICCPNEYCTDSETICVDQTEGGTPTGEDVCALCGQAGIRCCRNNSCEADGSVCNVASQICEDPPTPCNSTLIAGSDNPETFDIEMGRNQGRVELHVNTFDLPDVVTVSYEGKALVTTGCTGTESIPFGYVELQDGLGNTVTGACDGLGECIIGFVYGPGVSNKVRVRVDPNCAGTIGTQWKFQLSCPF